MYKNGERHSLSLQKLLREHFFEESYVPKLLSDERVFRYENSSYFITSYCRVFNSKTGKWLHVFYKKGYPTVNLSINGKVKPVSVITFLKERGGKVGRCV